MRESKLNTENYILNPKTGRYVKKTGTIGKLLVAQTYAGAVGETLAPPRGRGRPRKHLVPQEPTQPKRGRGRPRKNVEQLVKPPKKLTLKEQALRVQSANLIKKAIRRKLIENQTGKEVDAGNLVVAMTKRKLAQGDGAKRIESSNLIKKAIRRKLIENQGNKDISAGNLIVAMVKRKLTQKPKLNIAKPSIFKPNRLAELSTPRIRNFNAPVIPQRKRTFNIPLKSAWK